MTDRPENEVSVGLWDFAQRYAHLREGGADLVEFYLNRVRSLAETSEAQSGSARRSRKPPRRGTLPPRTAHR